MDPAPALALALAPTDPFTPPALRSGPVLGQVWWEQPSFRWTPLADAPLPPGRGQPLMFSQGPGQLRETAGSRQGPCSAEPSWVGHCHSLGRAHCQRLTDVGV